MEGYTAIERVSQALAWLGFEDVEVGDKFSATKFENNEESVLEKELTYSTKDSFIPKAVTSQLIKFMESVINYHEQKKQLEAQKEGEENA